MFSPKLRLITVAQQSARTYTRRKKKITKISRIELDTCLAKIGVVNLLAPLNAPVQIVCILLQCFGIFKSKKNIVSDDKLYLEAEYL